MRKTFVSVVGVLLVALLLAPGVAAQTPSAQEVVQAYYQALGKAVAAGDPSALAELFADDATVTVPAISPQAVQGKENMKTVFGGVFTLIKGMSIKVDDIAVDGDKVTVQYRMVAADGKTEVKATDTFVVKDGKIQSLTIEIATKLPAALPVTGAAGGSLVPGLLLFGGAVLVALGRRLAR